MSLIGSQPAVSHCYRRPRKDGVWRYNLFAMLHGHTREEVLAQPGRPAVFQGDEEQLDRALQHQPGGCVPLADIENHLAGQKVPRFVISETSCRRNLLRIECRKHLVFT